MDPIQTLFETIVAGEIGDVEAQVEAALAAKLDPTHILNAGMIAAMREVGARFEAGEYFVPDMLVSAKTMQAALAVLKPHLPKTEGQSAGTVLLGTVQGDLHDIGKNLVGLMLEGAGFEIIDLGTNVPPDRFVQAVRAQAPALVAMSALLTTTMPAMKTTLDALAQAGLRDRTKVIVGGAPITEDFARQIGADAFAPDASRAVSVVQALLGR